MKKTEIGIDISSDSFDACVELPSGARRSGHFVLDKKFVAFKEWLKTHQVLNPHLFMEATGRYWEPLSFWAHSNGYAVTIVNPRYIRKFAESQGQYNKTDKLDADCILSFGKSTPKKGIHRLWAPPRASIRELREINMAHEAIIKEITANTNRLKSGISCAFVKDSFRLTIAGLRTQKKRLEERSLTIIKNDPELKVQWNALKTQSGIGAHTAMKLLSMIEFKNFKEGRQLVCFAGLAPRRHESGKSVRKKDHISRIGHSSIRGALYLPAIVAMTHDPSLKLFKEQMLRRDKPKKVIVCAVMAKLLRSSFAVVRKASLGG